MKITNYELNDQNIKINFDRNFKQIRYLKLCGDILNASCGELECDEAEIKFTKEKTSLTINNESNLSNSLIVLIIIEINNEVCNYSYYINAKNVDEKKNNDDFFNFDLMGLGISKLMTFSQEKNEKEILVELPIKNRNIFANIKKKGR